MKVLVIGTGFGRRVVAGAYRDGGCSVDVVSPRDADAVSRGIAAGADLVSVHSPPFLHHAHVMSALDRGCAVLCDKPFGRDAAEAQSMRDQARQQGALNFLNFEFRRFPAWVKTRALIGDGAIGTPRHVSWLYFGRRLRPQAHRWLFDRDLAGGWVGAWGSHCIDILRWVLETEVATCGAVLRTEITSRPDASGVEHPSTAEDAFSAWFTMETGCTASVDTAASPPVALPQTVHVLGSDGAIEIRDGYTVSLRRPGEVTETFSFPPGDGDPHLPGLVPWFADVAQAVDSGIQISPSFDDGLAVAHVMDQMRATAREPRISLQSL